MKKCKTCGIEKEIGEFYSHGQMRDGKLNHCKQCYKQKVAINRLANLERYREYDRRRGRLPHRLKANRLCARQRDRSQSQIAWRERNPEKRAAHVILGNALRSGRIKKAPCEICGKKKAEAHHDDYAFPLKVRWLCRKHHAELHRRYKD